MGEKKKFSGLLV